MSFLEKIGNDIIQQNTNFTDIINYLYSSFQQGNFRNFAILRITQELTTQHL